MTEGSNVWSNCVLCIQFILSGSPDKCHSRPQSPSFLGHVVGKRGALEAAVTGCQKISDIRSCMCRSYKLLMLITDFCPSPLHWGKNFTSWALSREWLVWDVLKMLHFTQLGFTDNRPFALRGHVTSFLWKWKLYDFAFKKRLVGHILNKIMAIWFFKPAPFS